MTMNIASRWWLLVLVGRRDLAYQETCNPPGGGDKNKKLLSFLWVTSCLISLPFIGMGLLLE
eukprot:scaffold1485_cov73-Cylindrotheca_fusiformis.AAC.2